MEKDYTINKDVIEKCIKYFNGKYKKIEDSLTWVFNEYKKNSNINEVLIKVTTLNSLYGAGLRNSKDENCDKKKTIDVVTMASHIVSMNKKIDELLYSKDENESFKAYKIIESGFDTNEYKKCYVFASKYCSWHNNDVFPIMDSRVKKELYKFIISKNNEFNGDESKGRNIGSSGFYEYELFRSTCIEFRNHVNNFINPPKEYTLKDLDKFLWVYGEKEDKLNEILNDGFEE